MSDPRCVNMPLVMLIVFYFFSSTCFHVLCNICHMHFSGAAVRLVDVWKLLLQSTACPTSLDVWLFFNKFSLLISAHNCIALFQLRSSESCVPFRPFRVFLHTVICVNTTCIQQTIEWNISSPWTVTFSWHPGELCWGKCPGGCPWEFFSGFVGRVSPGGREFVWGGKHPGNIWGRYVPISVQYYKFLHVAVLVDTQSHRWRQLLTGLYYWLSQLG